MLNKYEILLFDLDDTLIDNYENVKYGFKEILKYRKETFSEEKFKDFFDKETKFWKDRAEGKIDYPYEFKSIEEKTKWIRAQRFLRIYGDIQFEEAVHINNLYMEALKDNVIPIEGTLETIKYLFIEGYRILIATNGPTIAAKSKVSKSGILDYVEDIIAADQIGYMKPHKEFYDGVLEKIQFHNKEKVLIIGDAVDSDIAGGILNNIDTCWFNRNNEENTSHIKPTFEIKKLIDLKQIL